MRLLALAVLSLSLFADDRNQPRGTSGEFDFYLLSLSWSPQYCSSPAGERDKIQCAGSRQYNFVLHGLWPQYNNGSPQYCATNQRLSNALVDKMLDIMPSPRLVRHEWDRHGVCSGLSATDYFAKARNAFASIKIPQPMQSPRNARTVAPAKIRDEIVAANSGLPRDSLVVRCTGRFLSEVRVCLDKNGKATVCPQNLQRSGCRMGEIIIQPLR